MPIPSNKLELLTAISSSYEKLRKELISIPTEYYDLKNMPGHKKDTVMSPENLISYLIGWGDLVLDWHRDIVDGKEVTFPHVDYKWTELGDLALYFYNSYSAKSREIHLSNLDKMVSQLINLI